VGCDAFFCFFGGLFVIVYIFTKYIQGQIWADFLWVSGVGMRRLRAVVTFFLVPPKQILKNKNKSSEPYLLGSMHLRVHYYFYRTYSLT